MYFDVFALPNTIYLKVELLSKLGNFESRPYNNQRQARRRFIARFMAFP